MTRKETALASLDIVSEGLAQEDGLAERLMRQRSSKPEGTPRALQRMPPPSPTPEHGNEKHSPPLQSTTETRGAKARPSFKSLFPVMPTSN
jgi:hypothetical protein